AGVEDLRRQQREDQERIRALEKQLNAADVRYQQDIERLQQEVQRSQRCCDSIGDLQSRIGDAENKISSASENVNVLLKRLEPSRTGGTNNSGESKGGGLAGGEGSKEGGVTGDGLRNLLEDLELHINSSVHRTEQICSYLEKDLKDYVHKELDDLRTVLSDRFDDRTFRIEDVELEVDQVQKELVDHDKRLSELENSTFEMSRRMEECGCRGHEGGGGGVGGAGEAEGGVVGTSGGKGGAGEDGQGIFGKGGGAEGEGSREGELSGGRENTTKKSLEWRVIANEGQIRHFNTRLKDLSVSGDSLHDRVLDLSHDVWAIKSLTGDHGELCGKVEEEFRRLKNQSQDLSRIQEVLQNMQNQISLIQTRLDSEGGGCNRICLLLQDDVHSLRDNVTRCTERCRTSSDTSTGVPGTGGYGSSLEAEKPLDGHSVIGGSFNNMQLKTLQGELTEIIFTFSSINDTLKGLEHTVQKHGSVITDLGELRNALKLSGRDVSRAEPVDVWSKAGEIHVHHEAEKLCYAMSDFSVLSGLFNTGLNHHVSGLWTHISGLNQSVIQHGGILDLIQKSQDNIHSRMKNLNSSLNQVLQSFSDQTGEPLLCSYSLLVFGSDGPAVLQMSATAML
ncbi:hypothetical protein GOODEAATRI_025010, partial [Goodea atripinnis]